MPEVTVVPLRDYADLAMNAYANDDKAYALDPPEARQVNVPLLRKTLEHITAHPDEWAQDTWACESACGTAFCLAGHVVDSLGHPLVWREDLDHTSYCVANGETRTIESVACHALGLDGHQATDLFAGNNSLHDLWNTAHDLTNGEIEIPADLEGRSGK